MHKLGIFKSFFLPKCFSNDAHKFEQGILAFTDYRIVDEFVRKDLFDSCTCVNSTENYGTCYYLLEPGRNLQTPAVIKRIC